MVLAKPAPEFENVGFDGSLIQYRSQGSDAFTGSARFTALTGLLLNRI